MSKANKNLQFSSCIYFIFYTWYQSHVAPSPAVVKSLLVEAVLVVAVLEKKLLQAMT